MAAHVTLTGDYISVETRDDGSVVLRQAILRRQNLTPATLEEFDADDGPIRPPDGDG